MWRSLLSRWEVAFFLLLVLLLAPGRGSSLGAWFVDQERFHMSAHGQVSCQDCHGGIAGQAFHPNPVHVNKSRARFFQAATCYACHEEVEEELKAGRHGSREGLSAETYQYCIRCHKPHEVKGEGEASQRALDPATPREQRCALCHEEKEELPGLEEEDQACMACHRSRDPKDPDYGQTVAAFCLHCHGGGKGAFPEALRDQIPLIDPSSYASTAHARTACTACHPEAARFGHGEQTLGDCRQCHAPHDEKTAHDLHARVTCGACHLPGVRPVLDRDGQAVVWDRPLSLGRGSIIHEMVRMEDERDCARCHHRGNRLGAAAVVLPPKGVLCMPCHAATFSMGDPTTLGGLGVFLLGLLFLGATWFSGARSQAGVLGATVGGVGTWVRALFTAAGLRAFFLDVLLQRRLYRRSEVRWIIHAMIFFPFLFRFLWGMAGLLGSLWVPGSETVAWLLDKNSAGAAVCFDVSGIVLLAGIFLALARGILERRDRAPGLPAQDHLALGLLGAVVAVGFVLEGMRIAMTGSPAGAPYAVVGNWVASLLSEEVPWTEAYGYFWYAHAILTAAFVAYLPFSRLAHVILAPVVLVLNAGGHDVEERRERDAE